MTYIVDGNAVQVVAVETWEYVSKNTDSWAYVINKTGELITSIVYTSGGSTVTKTLGYVNDELETITLSGDVPVSLVTLTKNIFYTNGEITSVTYT